MDTEAIDKVVDKVAAVMAKRKLTKVIIAGISVEMSPLGFDMPEATGKAVPTGGAMPPDEDMLEWSTGGPLPSELEAARKAEAGVP